MAEEKGKIVLDPIYGMIELDPLAVKIIDTRYFQRLRYIKQLSTADFVYPGATHTRFAHSIGVYHLACEMIKRIKSQGVSQDVGLTDKEETCIRVAALCHDMGHGPFSHTYEMIFKEDLQRVKKHAFDIITPRKGVHFNNPGIKHEDISVFLVKKMFKDNKNFDLEKNDIDIGLIQALIKGNYKTYENDPKMKAKKYMFQIVSNESSGMDVDKWDYFNRDAIACGVTERFQFDRALHVVRLVKVGEVYELGYRDHDAFSFYNMYNTRFTLHQKVYKHRVVVAVELMVKDVFLIVSKANKTPAESKEGLTIDLFPAKVLTNKEEQDKNILLESIDGSNTGKKYLMIEDYLKLRDDVLLKIQDSTFSGYHEAQKLIERLHTRKLYKLFKEFKVMNAQTQDNVDKMQKYLQKEIDGDQSLKAVIRIKVEIFNYGMKGEDPVEKMYFYRKGKLDEPENLKREEVSFVLPNVFQEYCIRVYQTGDVTDVMKTNLEAVLETFKEKYQEKLVLKRKQDAVSAEEAACTPSMSKVNKEDLPESNE